MSVTISGSGQIIKQVIQVVKTDAFQASNSGTFINIPGLSASITPTNSANKILVMVSIGSISATNGGALGITRNGTQIFMGDAAGTRTRVTSGDYSSWNSAGGGTHFTYLDSPATTSAVTYQAQAWVWSSSTISINEQGNDSDLVYRTRSASSITLMEVAYA